jgi:hypothetical protein
MALIAGFGGTVAFSGQSSVKCKSITINWEKESLDVTTVSDWQQKRAPGRFRRSGTLTVYRQDASIDDNIRLHLQPTNLVEATGAELTLSYTDQGGKVYDTVGTSTNPFKIQITSASITDDGTGAAMWELSWEEQG